MPVQGFVRLRKHQFGRQPSMGEKVAATRAYPFKGTPAVNLNWTDPDVDVGSIVTTVAPNRGATQATAALTDPQLNYNTIPLLMEGLFGGQEAPTGGGTAKTWTHEPAADAPLDDFSPFTFEFGDDVTSDWFQLGDGILDSVTITGPEGLGALTTSMTWRFGSAASTGSTDSPVEGTVPTPSLAVESNPALVYLKDMGIYIASSLAGLSAGQVTKALHTFTLVFNQEVDEKRWADGDQSFDVDDYGRIGLGVTLTCTFSKTSDTVGTGSESDAWFSDQAVDRFIRLSFTSKAIAQTPSTFYAWEMTMPMRYYTREEGESGGNSVVALEAHAFFEDTTAHNFFKSIVVNTLTADQLGTATS